MSVLPSFNILMLVIIPILISSALEQKQKQNNDDLCPRITSVLCVKDVLSGISSAVKEIDSIAQQIEEHIVNLIVILSFIFNLYLF
jgi:hypothetical protein